MSFNVSLKKGTGAGYILLNVSGHFSGHSYTLPPDLISEG